MCDALVLWCHIMLCLLLSTSRAEKSPNRCRGYFNFDVEGFLDNEVWFLRKSKSAIDRLGRKPLFPRLHLARVRCLETLPQRILWAH